MATASEGYSADNDNVCNYVLALGVLAFISKLNLNELLFPMSYVFLYNKCVIVTIVT